MTAQMQCMFNVLPPEGNGLSVLCETITVTKCFYAKSGHRNAQQRHFYFISPSPFTVFTGSCNVRKRSWPETVVTVVFIYYHEYLCRHHCCLKLDFKLKKKSPGQINFEVTCTFFSSWAPSSGRWMYEISCVSWLSWLNTVGAVLSEPGLLTHRLEQGGANYSSGAEYGPLGFIIWPTLLAQIYIKLYYH